MSCLGECWGEEDWTIRGTHRGSGIEKPWQGAVCGDMESFSWSLCKVRPEDEQEAQERKLLSDLMRRDLTVMKLNWKMG